ncbi:universal stress protein [Xylophilus sp.]|uniref:universal stress protein n=1 Tax=Xylophilus sp. TaxID=2653893 RepID=UPI0013B7E190|nr:universal stress protein [Xylophilus sp.]KAF1049197.1 MAG: TRAP-T-associated universal stress protein TeaD [Xylophilus sp.]
MSLYERILIATDGTALSKAAVQHGIALAALAGSEVIVVKVVQRYPQSYFEGAIVLPPDELARVEREWTEAAQAVVDKVKTAAQAQGLRAKAVVVKSDDVAGALIAAAKKHKANLIVMASHGRKGVKRLLLGSETQHVLTHSHIPVLVLR